MIKQFFNFISGGAGLVQIDEPIGFDKVPFVIRQEEGRKGRDVLFAGSSDANFELSKYPSHWFDEMLKVWKRYDFEMNVEYLLDYGNGNEVMGNVTVTDTDEATYIKFDVTQKLSEAKFKINYDVQTNLFSATDLDGNPIVPVSTTKMILPAHPTLGISKWSNPDEEKVYTSISDTGISFNPIRQLDAYDIKNSLTWLYDSSEEADITNYPHIEAKSKLTNVKVTIKLAGRWEYRPQEGNSLPDKTGFFRIRLRYGATPTDSIPIDLFEQTLTGTTNQDVIFPTELTADIPFVDNTHRIWMGFIAGGQNASVNRFYFNECTTEISATQTGYATVINVVKYIDALKYVTLSAGGLDVVAPLYDTGGIHNNQYITNLNLMRGLLDKPFNLSSKDLAEDHYREEINGDFEVYNDLFVGRFENFYTNIEMAVFNQDALIGYTRQSNSDYEVKQIQAEFKTFQSQKETPEGNTNDIVHGKLEAKLPNTRAVNNMQISIGFVRDALAISELQQKAIELSNSTATQDDNKVIMIDAVTRSGAINYQETAFLQHEINADVADQLILKNDQTFSFVQLGISTTGSLTIQNTDNAWIYNVIEVTPTQLTLLKSGGSDPVNITAGANTTFTYLVDPDVTLIARTVEGFSEISGFYNGSSFINLPWTLARIVRNFYLSELATACLFHPGEPIKNTLYTNNPLATTRLTTETNAITEGGEFIPTGAILTTWLISAKIICSIQEFFNITVAQRVDRGYVTIMDPSGAPVKGYIKEASWIAKSSGDDLEPDEFEGEMSVILKERYEKFLIQIRTTDDVIIAVNTVNYDSQYFYDVEDGIFRIFDSTRKQLLYDTPFDRVKVGTINDAAINEAQLIDWLDTIENIQPI